MAHPFRLILYVRNVLSEEAGRSRTTSERFPFCRKRKTDRSKISGGCTVAMPERCRRLPLCRKSAVYSVQPAGTGRSNSPVHCPPTTSEPPRKNVRLTTVGCPEPQLASHRPRPSVSRSCVGRLLSMPAGRWLHVRPQRTSPDSQLLPDAQRRGGFDAVQVA